MTTYKLSPSTLNLLKDCPRCFWLQLNKDIKRPEGIFPSLPSGMDNILKAHFDRFIHKDELPPELKELDGSIRLFDDLELLNKWRNNRIGIQWTDDQGNIIRGAVDNILKKGSKLIVLDYKTRGFPLKEDTHEHYQDQLDIYNFLLRKNNYETEDYSYLLFYHPKEVTAKGDVIFNTNLIKMKVNIKNAEKIIKEAIKVLNNKMPKPSKECKYCGYCEKR